MGFLGYAAISPTPTASSRRHTTPDSEPTGSNTIRTSQSQQRLNSDRPARVLASTLLTSLRNGLGFRRHSQQQPQQNQVRPWAITDIEIYYGSATGTTKRLAQSLAESVAARGVRVRVQDLEYFDAGDVTNSDRRTPVRGFVFVVATHYAGTPTPSAACFHQWLLERCEASKRECVRRRSLASSSGGDLRANPSTPGVLSSLRQWLGGGAADKTLPREELPFSGMQYAVFGAGDSRFLTFNAMGKFVDSKLAELGAERILSLGLGDAAKGTHRIFDAWAIKFLQLLPQQPEKQIELLHSSSPSDAGERVPPPPSVVEITKASNAGANPSRHRIRCRFSTPARRSSTLKRARSASEAAANVHAMGRARHRSRPSLPLVRFAPGAGTALDKRHCFPCVDLVGITRLTSSTDRRSVASILRLRLLDPRVRFNAGDTMAIFPRNLPEHVEKIAGHFGLDLEAWVELTAPSSSAATDSTRHERLPFPSPCTVRAALTEFLELRSLTPEFLAHAAAFASDPSEREQLIFLSDPGNASAFQDVIQRRFVGLPELLGMMPTLRMPFEALVNGLEALRPRYFTIASSPTIAATEFELAVSLGTPGRPCGLAVGYFRSLVADHRRVPPGVALRGFVSPSRFVLPEDPTAPMIMIAHGVGVAPMRAMIQERLLREDSGHDDVAMMAASGGHGSSQSLQQIASAVASRLVLLVGCRDAAALAFHGDLAAWQATGRLRLHLACSADPRLPRQHIQELVVDELKDLVGLIDAHPQSRLYVSGRVAMARDVRELFLQHQARRGNDWFTRLRQRGGYVEASHG